MDGGGGDLVDPRGNALPPCIVMERGESLQEWSDRAEPDLFTSLSVRTPSHMWFLTVNLNLLHTVPAWCSCFATWRSGWRTCTRPATCTATSSPPT